MGVSWRRRRVIALAACLAIGLAGPALADTAAYTYDEQGRLTSVAFYNASNVLQSTITYTYDAAGNRTQYIAQPPNNNPTAVNDSISLHISAKKTFFPTANDSDTDGDPISLYSVGTPSHGTASMTSSQVVYTPTTAYSGPDSFTYVVKDNRGGSATGTVSVTVSGANVAPVANADTISTFAYTGASVDFLGYPLANDTDVDEDSLTITATTNGAGGTVTNNATYVEYATSSGTRTLDNFTYTISDGHGHTTTGTVHVAITRECEFC